MLLLVSDVEPIFYLFCSLPEILLLPVFSVNKRPHLLDSGFSSLADDIWILYVENMELHKYWYRGKGPNLDRRIYVSFIKKLLAYIVTQGPLHQPHVAPYHRVDNGGHHHPLHDDRGGHQYQANTGRDNFGSSREICQAFHASVINITLMKDLIVVDNNNKLISVMTRKTTFFLTRLDVKKTKQSLFEQRL